MSSKKYSKVVDIYLIIYSTIMIIALLVLLFFSFRYWGRNFPYQFDIDSKMFYVAIGITFVTVITQWIEGRFKAILGLVNEMKGRELNGRRKKRK